MNQEDIKEIEISHVFDYSNVVAQIEKITFLIQGCYSYYEQFIKLCESEEEKNGKLKPEYRFYQYKRTFNTRFEVAIKEKESTFANINCKSYDSFVEAVNEGHLKKVDSVMVTLDLSFKRGKDMELKEHENVFIITFKPYDITFKRKANHDDSTMNQIENVINEILKKFKTEDTIFCTK